MLLRGKRYVAVTAEPLCLLEPVLSIGKRPPEDVHELSLAFTAPLHTCLGVLVAIGAVDVLGDRLKLVQRSGREADTTRAAGLR